MRKFKHMVLFILTGALVTLAACAVQNTSKNENEAVADLMHGGTYVFEARRAIAQNGFNKMLTSEYDLSVSADTITAWLPYFGRAYQAPMDPSKGGIRFTSTDFTYSIHKNDKEGWDVSIIPHDQNDVEHMTLSVSSTGYATLHVISTHRQPISFYGKVEKARP